MRVESLVGEKSNSRSVLTENGKCVIKVIFAVEKRNVGRPHFFGPWTFFPDPVRNVVEDIPATLPHLNIRRAADRQFAVANGTIGRAKFVPSVAVLNERRIVYVFDVSRDRDGPRLGVRSATPKQGSENGHCVYARAAGVHRDHDHAHNFSPWEREQANAFSILKNVGESSAQMASCDGWSER